MSLAKAAVVGLIAGICCGLVPMALGVWKGRQVLGVVALVVCALCGAFLGLLLAVPVAIVFSLAIVLIPRERRMRATAA
jgi:ABC-type phosphate transport system permease subunit